MQFNIERTLEIIERTPVVLEVLLSGLSDEWILVNEGGESWSVFDVVGHLVHGEETDWIDRIKITLSDSAERTYTPFDRFAQLEKNKGKTLNELLDRFKLLRSENIVKLKSFAISEADQKRTATHPALGTVTLENLISTWAVHDLNHLAQIARVMAKQYGMHTGPWKEYLRILK
jgi:uncharacterized damage-inducible protein DinB